MKFIATTKYDEYMLHSVGKAWYFEYCVEYHFEKLSILKLEIDQNITISTHSVILHQVLPKILSICYNIRFDDDENAYNVDYL